MNGTVSKTVVVPWATVGSNPTLSAIPNNIRLTKRTSQAKNNPAGSFRISAPDYIGLVLLGKQRRLTAGVPEQDRLVFLEDTLAD